MSKKQNMTRISRLSQDTDMSRYKFSHEANHARLMSLGVVLAIIALGFGGYKGAKAYRDLGHQNSSVQQSSSMVSCTVQATPGARIYDDTNEIGKADSHGNYKLRDVLSGARLQAKFGHNMSKPLRLTKADTNKTLQFGFSYLKGQAAQHLLENVFKCESNLANHNDQDHDSQSLDDYFANGDANPVYRILLSKGKGYYDKIAQDRNKYKHNHSHSSDKKLDLAVHYITNVKSTSLNRDGSVMMRYAIKQDIAQPSRDRISTYSGTAILRKVHGSWLIQDMQNGEPVSHDID